MNNKTTSTNKKLFKPLASKINKSNYPRFEALLQARRRPTVTNLRVNRALSRPRHLLQHPSPPPLAIRGEQTFEPSPELKARIERIKQAEVMLQPLSSTTTLSAPSPTTPTLVPATMATSDSLQPPLTLTEERKKELAAAREAYEEQIRTLRQKQEELQKAWEETAARLAQTEALLKQREAEIAKKEKLAQLVTKQQQRISELEQHYQNLQDELENARQNLQDKVAHLEKLKQAVSTPRERTKELGRQVQEQQEKIARLKQKRQELLRKMHREESELKRLQDVVAILSSQNKEKETLIRQQQQQLEQLQRDKEKISRFANELVKKLAQVENLQRVERTITLAKKPTPRRKYKAKIIKAVPRAQGVPILTDKPNAINGVVYDPKGELVEGAMIVIKNKANQPQRALRTNQLGQFVVVSPLPNGTYFIETQKAPFNFDIIEIELKGQVVEPIAIKAVN